jgi:transposase-like protein
MQMKPQSSLKKSPTKAPAERVVKDIRRATRRHFSAEDKIRIVLDGLRGEDSIAELCRKEGIAQSLYYTWSKEFMEAGKRRLAGDTAAPRPPVKCKICAVKPVLKECVADLTLENRLLKKHDRGWGRRRMRYPAAEKLEIIRLVEQSHLPAKQTLDSSASPGGHSIAGMPASLRAGRRR